MNDLQTVIIELERPRPSQGFNGRVAEAQFCVEDNHILLYDMNGCRIAREPIQRRIGFEGQWSARAPRE